MFHVVFTKNWYHFCSLLFLQYFCSRYSVNLFLQNSLKKDLTLKTENGIIHMHKSATVETLIFNTPYVRYQMSNKKNRSSVKVDTLQVASVDQETIVSNEVKVETVKSASQLLRETVKDTFTLFILFIQSYFRELTTTRRNGESIETKIFSLLELWTKDQKINFVGRKGNGYFGKHFFGTFEGGREVNADVFYNFLNKEIFAVENGLQKGFAASVSRIGFCFFNVSDAIEIKGRNVRGEIYLKCYNEIELEKQQAEKASEKKVGEPIG